MNYEGMFSARLENLISAALQDGVLTDQEREIIRKRAEKEGEDWDEVEMIINARLEEMRPLEKEGTPVKGTGISAPKEGYYITTEGEKIVIPNDEDLRIMPPKLCYKYTHIKKIVFQSSLRAIGEKAFYECENLEEIIFPVSIVEIGSCAFCNCLSLKKIDFSQCTQLEIIGELAFLGCDSLKEVILPASVKEIGDGAFSSSNIDKFDITKCNLTTLDGGICSNNTRLKELRIPDTVECINRSFVGKFNTIIMPASLKEIQPELVQGYTQALKTIDFSKVTQLRTIPSNFIADFPEKLRELIIPNGVIEIEDDAFTYSKIVKLFLPPTLETIGDWRISLNREIFCFSPALEKLESIVYDYETIKQHAVLYVLPQYLDKYIAQRNAERIPEHILEIAVIPDEYMYYYDN